MAQSQLHAHAPAADPETYSWNQGCAAQYNTMQANGGPAQPAAPVTVTRTFGTSPDLTIPKMAPPSSLYIKTLYQGTGAKVTSSEGMAGNYIAYDWSAKTNKLLASSFAQGTPSIFVSPLLPGLETALVGQKIGSRVVVVMPPANAFGSVGNKSRRTGQVFDSSWQNNTPFTTIIGGGQVIKGWDTGLVGQTVGSRVLLVVPPADGYGSAGQPQAGIDSTDTLVFVVDILAAT